MGSREVQIQQLFAAMREAEKSKDLDPSGYIKARIAYYRASEGDSWLTKETERLRSEANETIQSWRTKYKTLQDLRAAHRPNLDAIRAAETTQLGLQEDVSYALRELRKLISSDTDQALLKERESQLRSASGNLPGWVPTALDGVIVVLLLYALYSVYKVLAPRWAASTYLIASDRLRALRERLQPGLPGRTPGMFL